MKQTFLLLLVLTTQLHAQVKDQYGFAQSYYGIQSTYLFANGSAESSPDFLSGRINIGALHFWQKADFYISFSIADFGLSSVKEWKYSEGIITGARYLPFGLGKKFPTIYFGISWITPHLKIGEGPVRDEDAIGFEAGINWVVGKATCIELGGHYRSNSGYNYFISRNEIERIEAPSWGIDLSIKRYLDFTAGMRTEGSQIFQKKLMELAIKNGGLNDWSFAFGPSVSINLVDVPYLTQFSWMNERMGTAFVPDFALGLYLSKPDLGFRLSYRPMKFSRESYDLSVDIKQQHLAFEAFKFLFDYNGFVPFVGASVGGKYVKLNARDGPDLLDQAESFSPSLGFVFGWDIRPSALEWFILRTNLRYVPGSDNNVDGKRFLTGQLEFNFIQFVVYPQRRKEYKTIQKS